MTSVFDDKLAYMKSPYYIPDKTGIFRPFYITIGICTFIALSIFILNLTLGCCSHYSEYWNNRFTGNRWLVSLWTATPHNQPALDYTELQDIQVGSPQQVVYHHPPPAQATAPPQLEYLELKKRESDI